MMRIGSWCSIGVMLWAGAGASAHAQVVTVPQVALSPQVKPADPSPATVAFSGVVRDESGAPLSGAVISALGSVSAFAVSNEQGQFTFKNLRPGPYLIRAHLQNYLPLRGRIVHVTVDGRTTSSIELIRRPGGDPEPAILAAGVGTAMIEPAPPDAEDKHDHTEVAWRLRHLKRSVLKGAEATVMGLEPDDSLFGESLTTVGRAVGGSARFATSLLTELPVTGQLNLLTSTSFDRPQDLFSWNGLTPRSVAYLALEAPGPDGSWAMRGTLTQGDLASWIVAGSYVRQRPAAHAYEAGVSYSMQRYVGGNGEALAAMRDGSRNVGAVYALDRWTVHPRLQLTYGAKYARYDYLEDRGLVSPRATVSLKPSSRDSFQIRASAVRREVAPGAEEFLPPSVGLWLPPERTFSQVSRASFVPERHDQIELAIDRAFAGHVIIGVRAFTERVQDQVVTIFGVTEDAPVEIGHYQVGSAGDFEARGWGLSITRAVGERVRASVDYTQAHTMWRRRSPDAIALAAISGSVMRDDERIHDLTASVQSVVAPTATRLLVIYKLNSAYAASAVDDLVPRSGVRFDVQVNQALPFLNFSGAQWEMLVAVSNLFKEALYENSVYDELLVVRPPKRVLGGVTVRF